MKTLCFLLIPIFAFCQDISEIEKVQLQIDTTKTAHKKVDLYMDLIWEYCITGNDSALVIAEKALVLSKQDNYNLGEAKALESKGLYYEIVEGDYAQASKFYFEGIAICEKYNLDYASSIYHALGVLFHTSDDYENAKKYYRIAYDLAKKESKLDLEKKCLVNLASINSSQKNFEIAEELFLESLKIKGSERVNIAIYANLGNLYIRQKKYKKAIPFLEKATKPSIDNKNSEKNIDFLLEAKAALRDSSNSKELLKRANVYLNESTEIRAKSLMAMSLSKYYRALGNYKKALEFRDIHLDLYEEIKNKQRSETVYNLEIKYETEKKEHEIVEQKLTIEKKERQKNQILFGLIVSGMLLIGLFIFFKKRIKYQRLITQQSQALQKQKITELQQKNKLLALSSMIEGQEAERLRIAKDLHDSLGGLLSTVKNHFASIQKEIELIEKLDLTKKTNSLIDEACIEVRRISHNMMPHALNISGLQGAIEDLGEHLNEQGYETTIEISSTLKNIDETKKVMIYRLVQEVISNIRKHAQAKTILIQLLKHKKEVNLIIEDDGIGFNYDKAITKAGLGLKNINSRVQFLDGSINWDSEISKGTTIIINIPI